MRRGALFFNGIDQQGIFDFFISRNGAGEKKQSGQKERGGFHKRFSFNEKARHLIGLSFPLKTRIGLTHLCFFKNNVLARLRIILLQLKLFRFCAGIFLRCVEISRSGCAFQLNLYCSGLCHDKPSNQKNQKTIEQKYAIFALSQVKNRIKNVHKVFD